MEKYVIGGGGSTNQFDFNIFDPFVNHISAQKGRLSKRCF